MRLVPTADLELSLYDTGVRYIAGVDEVGRGSWAGPVVAAAVILPRAVLAGEALASVRDSKVLSAAARESLAETIRAVADAVSVGAASARTVDRLGLTQATVLAMRRAVARLSPGPDFLLVDGLPIKGLELPHRCVVDGDALCRSIAAASIVAKVTRDRWMIACDSRYPAYDFARNKGYGTAAHRRALASEGPCRLHRFSYGPICTIPLPLPPHKPTPEGQIAVEQMHVVTNKE